MQMILYDIKQILKMQFLWDYNIGNYKTLYVNSLSIMNKFYLIMINKLQFSFMSYI